MPGGAAADSSSLAAGFFCWFYPCDNFAPEPNQTAASKPSGYTGAHQSLSYRSYRSYKSYASATPPPPANRRCHQASKAYPCGKSARCITPAANLRPSHSTLRHCKPSGYTGACHGVARQGEDGRTNLSDRSDWSDTSATPTQHAHRRSHPAIPQKAKKLCTDFTVQSFSI